MDGQEFKRHSEVLIGYENGAPLSVRGVGCAVAAGDSPRTEQRADPVRLALAADNGEPNHSRLRSRRNRSLISPSRGRCHPGLERLPGRRLPQASGTPERKVAHPRATPTVRAEGSEDAADPDTGTGKPRHRVPPAGACRLQPEAPAPAHHLIELHGRSNKDLLKLLSAIETCVGENDIRSVRLDLDGETYTLAAQERPRPPARRPQEPSCQP